MGVPDGPPGALPRAEPDDLRGRVRAPMLLIAGEHDSRCPLGQVMVYAHALRTRARGRRAPLRRGHHALQVEEKINHARRSIDFFRRHLSS